jgi:1-acyl-sn-glycerol-3-phosphate acyltransferase
LAIQAGLPLVPISVSGSRHVMLKGRLMTCPGHVHLTVHEPVSTEQLEPTVEQAKALALQVRAIVVADVAEPGAPS